MNFGSVRSNRVKLFFGGGGGGGGGGGASRLIAYSNISPPPTLGWMWDTCLIISLAYTGIMVHVRAQT